jgi:hypothetical protein
VSHGSLPAFDDGHSADDKFDRHSTLNGRIEDLAVEGALIVDLGLLSDGALVAMAILNEVDDDAVGQLLGADVSDVFGEDLVVGLSIRDLVIAEDSAELSPKRIANRLHLAIVFVLVLGRESSKLRADLGNLAKQASPVADDVSPQSAELAVDLLMGAEVNEVEDAALEVAVRNVRHNFGKRVEDLEIIFPPGRMEQCGENGADVDALRDDETNVLCRAVVKAVGHIECDVSVQARVDALVEALEAVNLVCGVERGSARNGRNK